jgi:predicted nucleic acid-binding protein
VLYRSQALSVYALLPSKLADFWTDTYLAAFAEVTGYRLVTFDQGFGKYKKLSVEILGRAES